MKFNTKTIYIFLFIFLGGFVLVFSQAKEAEKATTAQIASKPTEFEKKCSVCHSLERIRVEMEKTIKEMHKKVGVELSEKNLKEIEETFTLKPIEEPHKALFQEKCANCHSLDKVVFAHQTKDEAEMDRIIQRMAEKENSKISKEEIQKIEESMKMLNEIYEPAIEAKPDTSKKK